MKQYDYFLLDWDGNLAKTLDLWLVACREPLIKRGIDVTDAQIGASFGAFIEHMLEWGVQDPEVAMEEADQIAKLALPNVELYPDALGVIEKLNERGKKLALITTSPHENIEHILEKYDMKKLFNVVIAGDDVTRHKPHPESLEKALELMHGDKSKAVMIGDSDKDLGAAQNFGIDSILFFPVEHNKFYDIKKLKKLNPTYIVDDFQQILETAG